eukprot:TRINITY_DN2034_c0_g1_i5.p1 TRINITY_DN2034_c0_g1~~TRINITY_DN2034_c0_g1_i5.p1  ORF type:complete len:162 (-),score=28.05 TRINITY_DN2034_c0_g1_i5:403-888(-)
MGAGENFWVDKKIRSDHILWLNSLFDTSFDDLPDVDTLRELVRNLDRVRLELNEDVNFDCHQTQTQLTCYPGEGARYVRHLDSNKNSGGQRRLTLLYYLNLDWKAGDGGELRIFEKDEDGIEKFVDVKPTGDTFLVFQSRTIEHEVLGTNVDRYAITLWLY